MSEQTTDSAIDLETLVRSMTDTTQNWEHAEDLALKAVQQAAWLRTRGVTILLDGQPFEPGDLSPHRMRRLIGDRRWAEEEL